MMFINIIEGKVRISKTYGTLLNGIQYKIKRRRRIQVLTVKKQVLSVKIKL